VSDAPTVTHVVCFGKLWHGDDGFGLHVHRGLRELDALPPGSRIFEAGTAGLDAVAYFEGCDRAVIVDAVRAGGSVGNMHRLAGDDLERPGGEFSLHDLAIPSLLAALAAVMRRPPEIVVIGAEVGEISPFTDRLSPPLEAAVPEAVRLVLREAGSHSIRRQAMTEPTVDADAFDEFEAAGW
jgi:hydrogenase maturation protease